MLSIKNLQKKIKLDTAVIDEDSIAEIDFSLIETNYKITIYTKGGRKYEATNLNAIECLMLIKPSALEGKRLKWAKRVWYIHNLVGHPLMQLFAMFKCYKLAMWIHDVTVPKPIDFKRKK